MCGTGLVGFRLEEMRRSRRVVRMRGGHAVDVGGVDGRVAKEGTVELVPLAGGREEREVAAAAAAVEVRSQ